MISSIHSSPSLLKLPHAPSSTQDSFFSLRKEKLLSGISPKTKRFSPSPKNGMDAGPRRTNAFYGVKTSSVYSKSEPTPRVESACVNPQQNISKTRSAAACTATPSTNTQSIFRIPKSTSCTQIAIKTASNSTAINSPSTPSISPPMMPYSLQAALIKISDSGIWTSDTASKLSSPTPKQSQQ